MKKQIHINTKDIINISKVFEAEGFELLGVDIKETESTFKKGTLDIYNLDKNEVIEIHVRKTDEEKNHYRKYLLTGWTVKNIESWTLKSENIYYNN